MGAGPSGGVGGSGGGNIPPVDGGPVCAYGQTLCDGNVAKVCDGQGGYSSVTTCPTECKDGLGCVTCVPNTSTCSGTTAKVCDATGTKESVFVCDGLGMTCDADGCHGDCSPVSLGMGYQGCDFWPTVTANSVWSDRAHVSDTGGFFHFGVLLGNVSTTSPANVTVKGGALVADQTYMLAPGESRTIALDWVADLKGPDWDVPYQPASPTQSIKKANGAYHVVSDRPIIAYQLNSLENQIPATRGCPSVSGATANCYSYSSDGSLLLPAHVLSSKYVVAGFHAWHKDGVSLPGQTYGRLNMGDFISITAPLAGTEVTVSLRPNQGILSGPDFPRVNPGDKFTFTMSAGQVVQLFTPGTTDVDTFSGTGIDVKDNKPVQVLSGVGCVNILDDDTPCGHIEDVVLPWEVLGKDYVVPALAGNSANDAGSSTAQMFRVQAITDGTVVTFEPKLFNAATLGSGEALDFFAPSDVRISSTTPFAVTQYLVGRTASTHMTDNTGGPSQLTVAPVAQFRTSYAFTASPQFTANIAVIAPTGTVVSLDTQLIPPERFVAVGASGMSVARVTVAAANRLHNLLADKPVGLVVVGVSPYSSYAFSGGLDLKRPGGPIVR